MSAEVDIGARLGIGAEVTLAVEVDTFAIAQDVYKAKPIEGTLQAAGQVTTSKEAKLVRSAIDDQAKQLGVKKEIDAVGNVVNAAAKGKIQEKLKVRETKKKAAKAVSQATNVASQTVLSLIHI